MPPNSSPPSHELSPYYLAGEIRATYAGMMIAVQAEVWQTYDSLMPAQLGRTLLKIATHVDARALRKHPRGPKRPRRKAMLQAAWQDGTSLPHVS
jgi:hypothetical protein